MRIVGMDIHRVAAEAVALLDGKLVKLGRIPMLRERLEEFAKANTRRSKIRAQVEHVFAGQMHRMGLVVRTIGIARATIKIGMANLAYNFQRLVWLEGRTAPA